VDDGLAKHKAKIAPLAHQLKEGRTQR